MTSSFLDSSDRSVSYDADETSPSDVLVLDDVFLPPDLWTCRRCEDTDCKGCPVTDSEDRYRKRERMERWKIAGISALAFSIALILGGIGAIGYGVYEQSAKTTEVVTGHNAELARIEALATAIRHQQKSDDTDRVTLSKETAQVAAYAEQLSDEVTANHANAVAGQQAICAQLNKITADLGISTTCSVSDTVPPPTT